jgi:hypothetical protein
MVRIYNKALFAWNVAIQQMTTAETTVMAGACLLRQTKSKPDIYSSLNIISINNLIQSSKCYFDQVYLKSSFT